MPINNSNLNLTLAKILKNADIDKHVSVHGLRHTGISYFIRHNVDKDIVAKMAGHSDSKITDQVYYTILSDQDKKELEKINRMVKGDRKEQVQEVGNIQMKNKLELADMNKTVIMDEEIDGEENSFEKLENIVQECIEEIYSSDLWISDNRIDMEERNIVNK